MLSLGAWSFVWFGLLFGARISNLYASLLHFQCDYPKAAAEWEEEQNRSFRPLGTKRLS